MKVLHVPLFVRLNTEYRFHYSEVIFFFNPFLKSFTKFSGDSQKTVDWGE